MNIRPYLDTLRRTYGPVSFVPMFDTVAGGSRHVRVALLARGVDGEIDSRRKQAAAGDRWIEVDLHESGRHNASHFVVTRDGPCGKEGPRFLRASTRPTLFATTGQMIDAIRIEIARNDHPEPARNRLPEPDQIAVAA